MSDALKWIAHTENIPYEYDDGETNPMVLGWTVKRSNDDVDVPFTVIKSCIAQCISRKSSIWNEIFVCRDSELLDLSFYSKIFSYMNRNSFERKKNQNINFSIFLSQINSIQRTSSATTEFHLVMYFYVSLWMKNRICELKKNPRLQTAMLFRKTTHRSQSKRMQKRAKGASKSKLYLPI